MQYVYRQEVTEKGRATGEVWTSEPFVAGDMAHVRRGVNAGHLSGAARWAEDIDGIFLYGLNRRGGRMSVADRDAIMRDAIPKGQS